jgi:hypothetical protein
MANLWAEAVLTGAHESTQLVNKPAPVIVDADTCAAAALEARVRALVQKRSADSDLAILAEW